MCCTKNWKDFIFIKIHFSIISHIHLGLPNAPLFCSSTKTLYKFLFSPTHATCPTHLSLLALITWISSGEEYNHEAPCNVISPSSVTSSLLGLTTFLSPCQVSHPHKSARKIIVLHISIFCIFGQQTGRQKILKCMAAAGILWVKSALNYFITQFWFVSFSQTFCHIFTGLIIYCQAALKAHTYLLGFLCIHI